MEPATSRQAIKSIKEGDKRRKVENIFSPLIIDDETIHRIMEVFEKQIDYANSTDENQRKKSDLLWECTYVTKLLQGNENGEYLGLDLGGTNFRVVRVVMTNGVAETTTKYYNLNDTLLSGPSRYVFDHIAESIEKFAKEENLRSTKPIPVGFTFSFPSDQKSLKHSILLTWTKCFKCTDGVGLDSSVMLEEAIERRKETMPVTLEVIARISDTTGALMAGNYEDRQCRIGAIIGTGSNACFVEKLESFKKIQSNQLKSNQVLVNTEWGAFGDNGCLDFFKCDIDKEIDEHSNHVHSFTFEKMFSGLYLGELVRLLLVKLINSNCLFDGQLPAEIAKRWKFITPYVTEIEKDEDKTTNTWAVLQELGLDDKATEEDVALIREACSVISERGAKVVGAALAVLLNHIQLPEVTIGIDGSLYEKHPKYKKHISQLLSSLVPTTKTNLILVKDGSGQGAAFVAAVESKS